MTLNDLSDIYQLFAQGFVVGGLFSALPFLIGWFINWLLALVKSA